MRPRQAGAANALIRVDEFESIRRFYDNEYYAGREHPGVLPWHCKSIADRLGDLSGRHVLDVACGTGEWLGYLQQKGADVAGIDLSRRAIRACLERFPGRDFRCGPAETLPYERGRFDLVTCLGSLEHFLDKGRALREMRRVAKPDARFLILVPNAGFLTRRLRLYKGTQQVKAQEDVLTLEEWRDLLHQAELRVISLWRDLHPLSWHWIRHGTFLSWPVRAAQAAALAAWPIRWQYQVYHYCKTVDA